MESLTFLLSPFDRFWSATVQSAPIIGTHLPSLSLSLSLQFDRPLLVFPRVKNQRSSFPSNPCAALGVSRILSRKFVCRHPPTAMFLDDRRIADRATTRFRPLPLAISLPTPHTAFHQTLKTASWRRRRTNERTNEQTNSKTNERANEWTKKRTNERANEWTKKRTNERANERPVKETVKGEHEKK
jgi:hypothetical protein